MDEYECLCTMSELSRYILHLLDKFQGRKLRLWQYCFYISPLFWHCNTRTVLIFGLKNMLWKTHFDKNGIFLIYVLLI